MYTYAYLIVELRWLLPEQVPLRFLSGCVIQKAEQQQEEVGRANLHRKEEEENSGQKFFKEKFQNCRWNIFFHPAKEPTTLL